MRLYLASLVQVILALIPLAILVSFVWAANTVVEQLNRIEAVLSEIGDPAASDLSTHLASAEITIDSRHAEA